MSWIIATIKLVSFMFPFLKELFIGNDKGKEKIQEPNKILKGIIIIFGCISLTINFFLANQSFNLGKENIELRRQLNRPESTNSDSEYTEGPPKKRPKQKESHYTKGKHDNNKNNNNNNNRKAPVVPPVLPPDRESYLKDLEAINKIH